MELQTEKGGEIFFGFMFLLFGFFEIKKKVPDAQFKFDKVSARFPYDFMFGNIVLNDMLRGWKAFKYWRHKERGRSMDNFEDRTSVKNKNENCFFFCSLYFFSCVSSLWIKYKIKFPSLIFLSRLRKTKFFFFGKWNELKFVFGPQYR